MESKVFNCDCLEFMRTIKDKYFDLVIVDPPYGGGYDVKENSKNVVKKTLTRTGGTWAAKYGVKIASWDIAPGPEYFEELFRVSKNQIIWGGNYFNLPGTRGFICWRKKNIPVEGFTLSPIEYAWSSFNSNAKFCEFFSNGTSTEPRIHPNQKPADLYKWLLRNYAKPGDKVFDSHVGSGSSRIACHDMGFDFTGCEIDKEYFEAQEKRFSEHCAQKELFVFSGGQIQEATESK